MNQVPPIHYKVYWQLSDSQPGIHQLSCQILAHTIQKWGQTSLDQLRPLAQAARVVGFKSVELYSTAVNQWELHYDHKRDKEFTQFVNDLRNIERGNWEREVVQIAEIIKSYKKKNKKWWEVWK